MKTSRKRTGSGLMKPMKPSSALAKVVGTRPLSRGEVTKKIWLYIKRKRLQDPRDGRVIRTDALLKKIFGTNRVNMFEISRLISKHLSPSPARSTRRSAAKR